MILKKSLLVGAVIAALGVGAIGVGTSMAQEGQPNDGLISGLVEAIAEKFNLSTDEVQAVFDEYHEAHQEEMQARGEEMRAEHEAKFEERLAQAVEDGELTQEQADAIIEKMDEMRGYMEEFKDLTPEERKEAMQGHAEDLKTWAEENGIPMEYLHMGPPPQQGGEGRPNLQPQQQAQ